jgi:uncharacterized membrane-anchored protein YjiN (DUF445 family)
MAWLNAHGGREWLQSLLTRYLQETCQQADITAIANKATQWLQRLLQEVAINSLLATELKKALLTGRAEQLWIVLLDKLIELTRQDGTRQAILQYLSSRKTEQAPHWWQKAVINLAEQTDSLNLLAVAAALQHQLIMELIACKRQEHPMHQWFVGQLQLVAGRLESDSAWAVSVKGWYQILVNRLDLTTVIDRLLQLVSQAAMTPTLEQAGISPLEKWVSGQVDTYWQQLMTDAKLQAWLDNYLRRALQAILIQSHELVGQIVKDSLGRLTDDGLNAFVDARAGEDLAWIRINGSIVGGIVGLVLYLVVNFVFDPFVSPFIRAVLAF